MFLVLWTAKDGGPWAGRWLRAAAVHCKKRGACCTGQARKIAAEAQSQPNSAPGEWGGWAVTTLPPIPAQRSLDGDQETVKKSVQRGKKRALKHSPGPALIQRVRGGRGSCCVMGQGAGRHSSWPALRRPRLEVPRPGPKVWVAGRRRGCLGGAAWEGLPGRGCLAGAAWQGLPGRGCLAGAAGSAAWPGLGFLPPAELWRSLARCSLGRGGRGGARSHGHKVLHGLHHGIRRHHHASWRHHHACGRGAQGHRGRRGEQKMRGGEEGAQGGLIDWQRVCKWKLG